MRVRGGTAGLLAALEHGICDELSAAEPFDRRGKRRLSNAEIREAHRREARRLEDYEKRKALAQRAPF